MRSLMKTVAIMLCVCIFSISACVSLKRRGAPSEGMKGEIIAVDMHGKELTYPELQNVIINCVPLKGDRLMEERSITENPDKKGNFVVALKKGEYAVEIFLKGFFVKSFQITIEEDTLTDLETVELCEIEAGSGEPIMGESADDVILNEGDVNIQPPSQ